MPYTPNQMANAINNLGVATLQNKTVNPTISSQIVTSDNNYDGLNQVTINAINPTLNAQTYTPGTTNQTIAADRWLTGAQTILGDSNLVASNIANGVSIFGVTGTYTGNGSGITPSGSLTITENDTYDVTNYAEVVVEVEGEGSEADPAYTINVPTQEALGMINNYFQNNQVYSILSSDQINQWQSILSVIFNMN